MRRTTLREQTKTLERLRKRQRLYEELAEGQKKPRNSYASEARRLSARADRLERLIKADRGRG